MTALLAALAVVTPTVTMKMSTSATSVTPGMYWRATIGYHNTGSSAFPIVPVQATPLVLRNCPRATFEIRRFGGEWKALQYLPGCGNVDKTLPKDFVTLKPLETKYQEGAFAWDEMTVGKENLAKGNYQVRVVFDTTAPLDAWVGGPMSPEDHAKGRDAIKTLWELTPHGVYRSEPTNVQIR